MRTLYLIVLSGTLIGCRFLGSPDRAKTPFDFGPPETSGAHSVPKALPVRVGVANVVAPGWMDNASMYYRLAYKNAANPLPYANSQWVMSPAALLTQRLRWTLGAANEGQGKSASTYSETYLVRAELVEFDQIFDRPDRSRGVLRLRVTLTGKGDVPWSQRTFQIEEPAATPDAAGGARALSRCALELSDAVTDWVTETLGVLGR